MRLVCLENLGEKAHAQDRLMKRLKAAWTETEQRRIVWRPSGTVRKIVHNKKFWFAHISPDEHTTTKRYINFFGLYKAAGNLQISVEANVPKNSNTRIVSGYFAKDLDTGAVYLMHDGGVGGGRKGVGRNEFFAWLHARPQRAEASDSSARVGLIVADIESKNLDEEISRFVQSVSDFKATVRSGQKIGGSASSSYKDYFQEHSGKKRRAAIREGEYITRHGDIVDALQKWRRKGTVAKERVVKNALIDLGIEVNGALSELYEVKTNCERQTLYTAIGQLLVHGKEYKKLGLFLVLPDSEPVPNDIEGALHRTNIAVVRFALTADQARITSPRK